MPAFTSPYALLGLLLAVAGLALSILYPIRPTRLLPWLTAAAFLLAFAFAHLHTTRHTTRLEIDRPPIAESEEDAFSYARLLAARGEDVADVRFAEDTQADTIDRAGLTEADLAFFDSVAQKQPTITPVANEPQTPTGPAPIVTDEATYYLAHNLARWNLNLTKSFLLLAAFLLGYDYLRRFNHYPTATFPLPLPGKLASSVAPIPALVERPNPPRRTIPQELTWLARRGDSFILLTQNPETAQQAEKLLTALPKPLRPTTLIHLGHDDTPDLTDDFLIESLWYSRASFLLSDPTRAESFLDALTTALTQRQAHRARTRRPAHLVWDLETPIPETLPALAQSTGLCILK